MKVLTWLKEKHPSVLPSVSRALSRFISAWLFILYLVQRFFVAFIAFFAMDGWERQFKAEHLTIQEGVNYFASSLCTFSIMGVLIAVFILVSFRKMTFIKAVESILFAPVGGVFAFGFLFECQYNAEVWGVAKLLIFLVALRYVIILEQKALQFYSQHSVEIKEAWQEIKTSFKSKKSGVKSE
jgi:hypothetical protein